MIERTIRWLQQAEQWIGPTSIPLRTLWYLYDCVLTLVIAAVIAIPLGIIVGHTGIGKRVIIALANFLRSLPTLGILTVLSLALGIGLSAPLIALTFLAIAPILTGTYSGITSIDTNLVEAARATGFSEMQIIRLVRLPLALPFIVSGLKSATIQVLATWTVAAFLPVEGLGRYLIDGLATRQYEPMLVASIIIIILEFIANGIFTIVEKSVTPVGVKSIAEQKIL